jgi:hypothetical protein
MQISAILSDYDGTLCSTSNMRDFSRNQIPIELDTTLSEISKDIPVCVISSKDFGFLSDKITFARIVSCIMGIETINLTRRASNGLTHIKNDSNVLFDTQLITDIDTLTANSVLHILSFTIFLDTHLFFPPVNTKGYFLPESFQADYGRFAATDNHEGGFNLHEAFTHATHDVHEVQSLSVRCSKKFILPPESF